MKEEEKEQDFSIKQFFVPLTTGKAIHWIIVIGLIVYANMLLNEFVWDDWANIVYNENISSGDSLNFLDKEAIQSALLGYRPLFFLYISLLYKVLSEHTFFYHFLQLLFHIGNSILIFKLFSRRFTNPLALFLSLIFLIHPIQVESVVWISAGMVPLSLFFGLLAVFAVMDKALSVKISFYTYLLLLSSSLIRETGLVFLILIVLYGYLYNKEKLKKIFVISIATLSSYSILRFLVSNVYFESNHFSPYKDLTFLEKIITVPAVFSYYFKVFAFPYDLAINQLWIVRELNVSSFFIPLLFLFLLVSLIIYVGLRMWKLNKEKLRLYIFFLTWLVLGFVTLSPFVPIDLTVADRYFYFPMIGLLGIIGIILGTIEEKSSKFQKILLVLGIVFLILLSIRTVARNENWRTYLTLVKHDIKVENNFEMQNMMGQLLALEEGDYHSALEHFITSTKMYPYEINLKNTGSTYMNLGNKQEALKYFYLALEGKNFSNRGTPNLSTYEALTTLLFELERFEETKEVASKGVNDYPDSLQLYILLALSQYKLNNNNEALEAAKKAYEISPSQQTHYLYTQIKNNEEIIIN